MPSRLIHQRYDIYIDGVLTYKGRDILVVEDRSNARVTVRKMSEGDVLSLENTTRIKNDRANREHVLEWTGISTNPGEELTVTAVKRGCGCGGGR